MENEFNELINILYKVMKDGEKLQIDKLWVFGHIGFITMCIFDESSIQILFREYISSLNNTIDYKKLSKYMTIDEDFLNKLKIKILEFV